MVRVWFASGFGESLPGLRATFEHLKDRKPAEAEKCHADGIGTVVILIAKAAILKSRNEVAMHHYTGSSVRGAPAGMQTRTAAQYTTNVPISNSRWRMCSAAAMAKIAKRE